MNYNLQKGIAVMLGYNFWYNKLIKIMKLSIITIENEKDKANSGKVL